MDSDIPHLDCEITKEDLKNGIAKVVEFLRPQWNIDHLKIEDKSNGYINLNYAVNQPSGENGIFVRIVNITIPGQLQRATNCMKYLKRRKLGAQLLLTFNNGLVMEFLEGVAVTWETIDKVKDRDVWLSVAREMARYHAATDLEDIKKYHIPSMDDMRQIHKKILTDLYNSGKVPDELKQGLPTPEQIFEIRSRIIKDLEDAGAETRFCHIDANPTNLLIQDGKNVVFVDYDDCIVDYTCTEISRFFVTLCGVLQCDFSKLPTPEEEDVFIREYLEYRRVLEPERGPVTEKLVDYWKYLVKRSTLLNWAGGSAAAVFLTQISDKPVDRHLGHKFWKRYLDTRESVLQETFTWD